MALPFYPTPENEATRLRDVRRLAFLYEDEAVELLQICQLAAKMLGTRSAAVTLVDEDVVHIISRTNTSISRAPREESPCTHTILGTEILQFPDMRADPRTVDLPIVRAFPHLRFYVGAPLSITDGVTVGALALSDDSPRRLTQEERATLQMFASIVSAIMRLHVLRQDVGAREGFLLEVADVAEVGGWQVDLRTKEVRLGPWLRSLCQLSAGAMPEIEEILAGFVGADAERMAAAYRRLKDANEPFDLDGEYLTPGGERRWIRMLGRTQMRGEVPVRLLGAFQDTTARMAAEATIAHIAHHDSLTGLPNRLLFGTRLDAAISEATLSGSRFAVMIVDFDHFKTVNDRYGHAAGDDLLKHAAEILTEDLGARNTIARLGGDEFGLIMRDAIDGTEIQQMAERVALRLKFSFASGNRNISSSASIGTAVFPDDGTVAGDLLRNADIALYSAKAERRGRAVLFRAEMRQRVESRESLLADIRRGLQTREFELFYQPIVGRINQRGAIVDVEALMRWHHPVLGLVTPAFFGIGFEEPEVATLLGEVALAQGFAQLRDWAGDSMNFGSLAINLAPAQVHASPFLRQLVERIRRQGLPADRLTLEITEGTYLNSDSGHLTADLQALQAMGVAISLDDFGTGYGSLSHLRHFSVDQIKIDKSFVAGIGRDMADGAIVQAMINLGRALNLDVVAEGVESAEQADFLARSGCRHMQGFHFAPPLPAAKCADFIAHFADGACPVVSLRA